MRNNLAMAVAAMSLSACGEGGGLAAPPAAPPGAIAPVSVGPTTKPPLPAFKPGTIVTDRTGAQVGLIQTITDTPGGLNVVIAVDGKLVGVRPSTLQHSGEKAVSSQTKEEILATAGAPP
jgi:hypothetical protein